ncbi:unnamed protein product, partial [Mesorhabditis spiculigera]
MLGGQRAEGGGADEAAPVLPKSTKAASKKVKKSGPKRPTKRTKAGQPQLMNMCYYCEEDFREMCAGISCCAGCSTRTHAYISKGASECVKSAACSRITKLKANENFMSLPCARTTIIILAQRCGSCFEDSIPEETMFRLDAARALAAKE